MHGQAVPSPQAPIPAVFGTTDGLRLPGKPHPHEWVLSDKEQHRPLPLGLVQLPFPSALPQERWESPFPCPSGNSNWEMLSLDPRWTMQTQARLKCKVFTPRIPHPNALCQEWDWDGNSKFPGDFPGTRICLSLSQAVVHSQFCIYPKI